MPTRCISANTLTLLGVKLVDPRKGVWFLVFTWSVRDRYTRVLISPPALSLPFYFPLVGFSNYYNYHMG